MLYKYYLVIFYSTSLFSVLEFTSLISTPIASSEFFISKSFIFLLSSCSIKNYNSIENLKEQHNNQNPDKLIFLNKKNFNPSKKIFKKN